VANRRAWADPARLTPDVLALYRRPLHVEGWDVALVEVSRGAGAWAARGPPASLDAQRLDGMALGGNHAGPAGCN